VYSFTARITNDGGVTPFRVGATITGTFTYDLKGVDNLTDLDWCGHFVSPRNAFAFQFGDECFSGTGPIWTTLSVTKRHEHVGVVAHDLRVPKGWEIEQNERGQSFGLWLENAPPRGMLPRKELPDRLMLANWINSRQFLLDFCGGVRFPGGEVKERATVVAIVEELQEARKGQR
jgi:hypothetical protein